MCIALHDVLAWCIMCPYACLQAAEGLAACLPMLAAKQGPSGDAWNQPSTYLQPRPGAFPGSAPMHGGAHQHHPHAYAHRATAYGSSGYATNGPEHAQTHGSYATNAGGAAGYAAAAHSQGWANSTAPHGALSMRSGGRGQGLGTRAHSAGATDGYGVGAPGQQPVSWGLGGPALDAAGSGLQEHYEVSEADSSWCAFDMTLGVHLI